MSARRKGFTLVELLVVIAIIVALIAIVLAFRHDKENHRTSEGASQLETFISAAKARALRENRPIAVRFISSDNFATFDSVVLMDDGADWMPLDQRWYDIFHGRAPGSIYDPITGDIIPPTVRLELPDGTTIGTPAQNTVRQLGVNLQGTVAVGDMLEIHETTPSTHRIMAIDYATGTMRLDAVVLIGPNGQPYVSGIPNVSSNAATWLPWNYRYIRQARPLLGEQPFPLPKDVVIRGPNSAPPTSIGIPVGRTGQYEILFSPAGIPINASGKVVLYMEDKNNAAKPILLAIYQTGSIKSHPVGPVGNTFANTTDGR